jgi:hypothetical protein
MLKWLDCEFGIVAVPPNEIELVLIFISATTERAKDFNSSNATAS